MAHSSDCMSERGVGDRASGTCPPNGASDGATGDVGSQPVVLLISPPLRAPNAANLAVATLRPLLRAAGWAAETLEGSLLFPRPRTDIGILASYSTWLFLPYLHSDVSPAQAVDMLMRTYLADLNLAGLRLPESDASFARLGIDEAALRAGLLADVQAADQCLLRMVQVAAKPCYDVLALSCTFETQIPAAIALTRRVIAARAGAGQAAPHVILGGAACSGDTAGALCQAFPELTAVCHCEGERVIVPLAQALRGQRPLSSVPGIAFRDRGLIRRTAAPAQIEDLDELPVPDFAPYMVQHAQSAWQDTAPEIFFETSRGCWWGEKHLCTFCGLNADALTFRRKTPARALSEIRGLYDDYPQADRLVAADNILPLDYIKTVMPGLQDLASRKDRPLDLFFEVKSNLTREQIQVLSRGGVRTVQPGIESFSDDVLALMDKGATGLGQVQCIKWMYEADISMVYNILLQNPGEQIDSYRQMLDMIPYLRHLPPPTGLAPICLERYSPYFMNAEQHGIRNVRPKGWYREFYRGRDADLGRLAYAFDYDHPILQDDALRDLHRQLVKQVDLWSRDFRDDLAFYVDTGDRVVITDRRGESEQTTELRGVGADLFRYLDKVHPWSLVRGRFSQLDESVLASLLAAWQHRRFVLRVGDRLISVLPRRRVRGVVQGTQNPQVAQAPSP